MLRFLHQVKFPMSRDFLLWLIAEVPPKRTVMMADFSLIWVSALKFIQACP